jgi:hypothetical protein
MHVSEIATLTDFQIERMYFGPAARRAAEMKGGSDPTAPAPPPMTFLEPDGSLLPKMDWLVKYGTFVLRADKAAGVERDPGILWEQIAAKVVPLPPSP